MMAAFPFPTADALRNLRAAVSGRSPAVSDAELLDRFARTRDEAAFELLVWRHGRLVWGVCRWVAREHHAAEDAFQATFLALARHAGSVADRSAVAGWLYRVAYRAALEAGRRARHRPEPLDAAGAVPDRSLPPPEAAVRRDLLRVIDAEVGRLPERFREPFVLCELQGLTNAEAAAVLGCPVGTVESRLTRARARLRQGLSARGVTAAGGFAGLSLAAVPADVLAAAVRAGVEGPAAVRAGVAALAARACGATIWLRVSAGFLAAVAAAAAVGLSAAPTPGGGPPAPPRAGDRSADERSDADSLPAGVIARFGSARFRAPYGAWNPAFSPDGKGLAVAATTEVRVFDTETGWARFTVPVRISDAPLAALPVPRFCSGGGLIVLHADQDGRRLIARRVDRTGQPVQQALFALPGGMRPWCWNLSGDGARAAVVWTGPKTVLQVLDTQTAAVLATIPIGDAGHTVDRGPVMSPDGRQVAVVTTGPEVRVFAADTGEELDRWGLPGTLTNGMAFSPDGGRLAVCYSEREWVTVVRDLRRKVNTHRIEKATAAYLAFRPSDNELLIAYGSEGSATVWDLGRNRLRYQLGRGTATRTAAFSPNGKVLMTGDWGGAITLWDVATGEKLPVSADPPSEVRTLRFLDDGKRLAGLADGWVTWDVTTRAPGPRLNPLVGQHMVADLSPDGRRVAICPGGRLAVSDTRTGVAAWTADIKERNGPYAIRYSADGRRLLIRFDTSVEIRDSATGRVERSVPVWNGAGLPAVSPDGRIVVITGLTAMNFSSPISAYDLEAGTQLWADSEFLLPDWPQLAAFSPDGRLVAYISLVYVQTTAGTWRTTTGRLVVREAQAGRLVGKVDDIGSPGAQCMAFSPDGRLVAIGGYSSVSLWDVAACKRVWEFKHGSAVTAVAFSPDGLTLAAASAEAPVYLWDVYGTRTRTGSPPDRAALRQAVADLDADDPAVAFRAARTLHAAPGEAVAAIRDGVRPAAAPDPAAVRRLIADLDSPDFQVRDRAERQLTASAPRVAAAVKAALADGPSPEQKERLTRVLAASGKPTAADRQGVRAVAVLGRIGTPEAKAVLRKLAAGADGSATTRAASEALAKIGR